MTERVPADEIENIVGRKRSVKDHYARAVSAEQTVYVLHSRECLAMHADLRECPWSLALDRGIDLSEWVEDVLELFSRFTGAEGGTDDDVDAWTQGVQWFTTREAMEETSPEPAVAGMRVYN